MQFKLTNVKISFALPVKRAAYNKWMMSTGFLYLNFFFYLLHTVVFNYLKFDYSNINLLLLQIGCEIKNLELLSLLCLK